MAIARPVDRRLFFLLDRTHAQISNAADIHLKSVCGIGTSQAAVLTYLGFHDNCSLSELSDGVGRNNSAITGLIDRMEKGGLVERKQGKTDRRAKTVCLTDKGWALRETVTDALRDFNERLSRGMTGTDLEIVLKFLKRAVANVTPKP